MLRKTVYMMLIAFVLAIFMAAGIYAAPAGTQSNTSTTSTAKMHIANSHQAEMHQLWSDERSLSDDWSKIEQHYNSMMQITDPTQLKAEMAKHQEMMKTYNDRMMAFRNDWSKDMASYEPKSGNHAAMMHATRTVSQPKKMETPAGH